MLSTISKIISEIASEVKKDEVSKCIENFRDVLISYQIFVQRGIRRPPRPPVRLRMITHDISGEVF